MISCEWHFCCGGLFVKICGAEKLASKWLTPQVIGWCCLGFGTFKELNKIQITPSRFPSIPSMASLPSPSATTALQRKVIFIIHTNTFLILVTISYEKLVIFLVFFLDYELFSYCIKKKKEKKTESIMGFHFPSNNPEWCFLKKYNT